jgi:uncharacterized protein (TIGR00255 family)
MIRSMTGIGSATRNDSTFEVTVRAQTVNSRYLDINVRLHHTYSEYEHVITQLCRKKLSRGKVDFFFDIRDLRDDTVEAKLNEPLIYAYMDAVTQVTKFANVENRISPSSLLAFPHVLKVEAKKIDDVDSFKAFLLSVTEEALDDLIQSRSQEGEKIAVDIDERLELCSGWKDKIDALSETVKKENHNRIKLRIEELIGKPELNQDRLEQEVAYMADKADISEEVQRFSGHLEEMHNLLQSEKTLGKKLDFTVQELNREVNTMGSKSRNIEISRLVIDIKAELEKVREQVQNVE